jgi:hypothetical protein
VQVAGPDASIINTYSNQNRFNAIAVASTTMLPSTTNPSRSATASFVRERIEAKKARSTAAALAAEAGVLASLAMPAE